MMAASKSLADVLQKLRLPVLQHMRADLVLCRKGIQLLLTFQNPNNKLGLALRCACSLCHVLVSYSLSYCVLPCSRYFFEFWSEIMGPLYFKLADNDAAKQKKQHANNIYNFLHRQLTPADINTVFKSIPALNNFALTKSDLNIKQSPSCLCFSSRRGLLYQSRTFIRRIFNTFGMQLCDHALKAVSSGESWSKNC